MELIEREELKHARVMKIITDKETPGTEEERNIAETAEMFPQVPTQQESDGAFDS